MDTAGVVIVLLIIVGVIIYWQAKKRNYIRRAGRRSTSAPVRYVTLGPEADVVGEAYHQRDLESIAGPKTEESHYLAVDIELQREPDNPHDSNAIRCLINGRVVGHINREAAASLQPLLQQAEREGVRVRTRGYIVGGWRRPGGDEGHYGVKLETAPSRTGPRESTAGPDELGTYAGHYYTEYVEMVKDLKRRRDYPAAETLLLRLIKVIEEESRAKRWIAPPWYTEQLAIIYRKQKNYEAEVAILERYKNLAETVGFPCPEAILSRLEKARVLRAKANECPQGTRCLNDKGETE